MKLGYCIENFDTHLSPDKLIETAQQLEDSGFHSIWTTDHVLQQRDGPLPIYDSIAEAITTLAFLSGYTKSIKLGVSTLVLPIREPILVAKQLATLDYLTNGRLVASFGAGWNEKEFEFLGQEFNDRGKRFDEALQLIRGLWTGSKTFKGKYYQFEDASFKPIREDLKTIPILIAGNSKYALNRAINLGDGWHPGGGISGLEVKRKLEEAEISSSFEVWVRKGMPEGDITPILDEYENNGVTGIVVDISRIKSKEDHQKRFNELIQTASTY
ncbi:MAG: TIGR03619 family F420-dependent LLM class oxidoreductase [Candidatus Kariarchaeaceae archaeon]|jgi:probable F420-dependent oxidoreductase